MKIKKIEFKNHNVFKNHTVVFGETDIPKIVFLVGNNGSGKTKVLDMLYYAFSDPFGYPGENYEVYTTILFSEKEKAELALVENEIIYKKRERP